jgi:hypothetical protein
MFVIAVIGHLAGCVNVVQTPEESLEARLILEADLAGTSAILLAVEVTAPDIRTPLVFNLEVEKGRAVGVLTLPTGRERLLVAHAFDSRGRQTHSGSRVIDVRAGPNDAVAVVLLPLMGEVPIVVTVGSYAVVVNPVAVSLEQYEQVQLSAEVLDADGIPVAGAAVEWASLNTAVTRVDRLGRVTGIAPGEAQVVAVYAGSGAAARISVGG